MSDADAVNIDIIDHQGPGRHGDVETFENANLMNLPFDHGSLNGLGDMWTAHQLEDMIHAAIAGDAPHGLYPLLVDAVYAVIGS